MKRKKNKKLKNKLFDHFFASLAFACVCLLLPFLSVYTFSFAFCRSVLISLSKLTKIKNLSVCQKSKIRNSSVSFVCTQWNKEKSKEKENNGKKIEMVVTQVAVIFRFYLIPKQIGFFFFLVSFLAKKPKTEIKRKRENQYCWIGPTVFVPYLSFLIRFHLTIAMHALSRSVVLLCSIALGNFYPFLIVISS